MKEITVTLDPTSIDSAIAELKEYNNRLKSKVETAVAVLAGIGADKAKEMYSHVEETVAPDDDPSNVMTIYADFTQDDKRHIDVYHEAESSRDKAVQYVVGHGSGVGFAEFGAGVYSDPTHPYVGEAPFPVYPGSWAEHDKRQYLYNNKWWFSNLIYFGIAPARGLYEAQKEMAGKAKQVFYDQFQRGNRP